MDGAKHGVTVVDAHQHFWDPSRVDYPWLASAFPELDRKFGFEDLAPHLSASGVDATVLVQAADSPEENDAMFGIARLHPEVAGVVAWVPLDQPSDAEKGLEEMVHRERFVGVRNLLHVRPDPDWVLGDAVSTSLGLLERAHVPFDFVSTLPRHLEHLPVLCERHPELTIVVDHLGKPPVGDASLEPWAGLLGRAARSPNVYAKLSGLYRPGDEAGPWTLDDLRPIVRYALDVFGAERLMFGSDWPVCQVAGGYAAVTGALLSLLGDLGEHERRAVLGGTAVRVYGLKVATGAQRP